MTRSEQRSKVVRYIRDLGVSNRDEMRCRCAIAAAVDSEHAPGAERRSWIEEGDSALDGRFAGQKWLSKKE
jgi:hypothetical protein